MGVRTDLLEFDHLPKKKLAELYGMASKDLAVIAVNISYCEDQLAKIEARNPKEESDNSDIGFYRYFLKRNQEAQDQIVVALANRIHREALRAASGPISHGFDFHVPWDFRWFPLRYSAADYSPIRHNFLELPLKEFYAVQESYRNADWPAFDLALNNYLREHQPVRQIRGMIGQHHLLFARKDVLITALDAYERGEFALFASAAATQIEGIFEDACQLSDVSPKELRVATLIPKLDALTREGDIRIDYPYYAFKFPILRNRIAHGRSIGQDLDRTASLLLLDLHDACSVVRGHPAPPNAIVDLLTSVILQEAQIHHVVEFAVVYVQTDGKAPDPFYGLSTSFKRMTLAIERDMLWDFLDRLASQVPDDLDDDITSGLRFLAIGLKKLRSSVSAPCRKLLALLGARGTLPFDAKAFLNIVRRTPGHDLLALDPQDVRCLFIQLLQVRAASGVDKAAHQ